MTNDSRTGERQEREAGDAPKQEVQSKHGTSPGRLTVFKTPILRAGWSILNLKRRRDALASGAVPKDASARVRSPIGLVPLAFIAASRAAMPGNIGRSKRLVMKRRMDVVSYGV